MAIAFILALLTSLAMWVGIITLFFMNPVLFLWIVFLFAVTVGALILMRDYPTVTEPLTENR